MKTAAKIISTFFGAGFFPFAPGTLASALVIVIYRYGTHALKPPLQAVLILALFLIGTWAATVYARELNQKDPGRIVIDEVCGQCVALFMIAPEWKSLIPAFFLFRIFDIIKPYPIRKLEHFPQGWGIMADDVGAGLASGLILRLFLLIL